MYPSIPFQPQARELGLRSNRSTEEEDGAAAADGDGDPSTSDSQAFEEQGGFLSKPIQSVKTLFSSALQRLWVQDVSRNMFCLKTKSILCVGWPNLALHIKFQY